VLGTAFNLPILPTQIAKDAKEAITAARKVGYPVVAKLASKTIHHKTDVDGVFLNLHNSTDIKQAFVDMKKRLRAQGQLDVMDGMYIQPMMEDGVEVMIGVDEDPTFGPLLAFGLGGIHMEIISDVTYRVTPLEDTDAAEMIREIRGYRLLEGHRGHLPGDIEAIEELLLRVSMLVEEIPEIQKLEFNPVIALAPGEGCSIVDARIKVGPPAEDQPARYMDMG